MYNQMAICFNDDNFHGKLIEDFDEWQHCAIDKFIEIKFEEIDMSKL